MDKSPSEFQVRGSEPADIGNAGVSIRDTHRTGSAPCLQASVQRCVDNVRAPREVWLRGSVVAFRHREFCRQGYNSEDLKLEDERRQRLDSAEDWGE